MVVDEFYVRGIRAGPAETDPPLVVDPNAVLPGAIAFELLQPVAGRHAEVIERFGGIQGDEFPEHRPSEIGRKAPYGLAARTFSIAFAQRFEPLFDSTWIGSAPSSSRNFVRPMTKSGSPYSAKRLPCSQV